MTIHINTTTQSVYTVTLLYNSYTCIIFPYNVSYMQNIQEIIIQTFHYNVISFPVHTGSDITSIISVQ